MAGVKKKSYEKPTVTKYAVGYMNRFGRAPSTPPKDTIDGARVSELMQRFGSPLWVISESTLRQKYREQYQAFSIRYPKMVIAYSYKTNFLPAICALFHQEGAWAEVVSGFEYDIALKLGVPGDHVVFNGPFKTRDEMQRAIKQNSRLNIDSLQEIYDLEKLASEMGQQVKLGIRVNMQLYETNWDRFGFNLESGQALEACKQILSSKNLKLSGIHIHIGTFILDVNIYRTMVAKLIDFYRFIKDYPGVEIEYLDIGGGYASINTLHDQWIPGEYACPTFDEYAEAICPPLLAEFSKTPNMPLLILEPGRALVDEGVHLITTVVSRKTLSEGGTGIVVDAGINLLPMTYWYRYKLQAVRSAVNSSNTNTTEVVSLYGPLCMHIDCLQAGITLPPLRAGDILVVNNTGAYNFSMSTQFIRPRPTVVMIAKDGSAECVRTRETTDYITQLDRIPQRLIKK